MQSSGGGGGGEATAYFSSTRYQSPRSCPTSWDRIIRRIPASLTWATSLQPPPLSSSLFPLAGQKDVRKRSFENARTNGRRKKEDERIATERRRRIKIIKFHSVNHLLILCGILALCKKVMRRIIFKRMRRLTWNWLYPHIRNFSTVQIIEECLNSYFSDSERFLRREFLLISASFRN